LPLLILHRFLFVYSLKKYPQYPQARKCKVQDYRYTEYQQKLGFMREQCCVYSVDYAKRPETFQRVLTVC